MTEILPATDEVAVHKAIELLKQGEVVVYPTDTIYGLAASIATESGIQKIYEVKWRSRAKPIMLHIMTFEQFRHLTKEVSESTIRSLQNVWPGAMAGIFIKNDDLVPSYVTSGQKTVALRIPDHPLCLELVRGVGHPVAVTSANVSGMETHKTAFDVAAQLGEQVPLVLDGGPSQREQASTLVDFTGKVPRLLREGALSFSQLHQFLPNLEKMHEN